MIAIRAAKANGVVLSAQSRRVKITTIASRMKTVWMLATSTAVSLGQNRKGQVPTTFNSLAWLLRTARKAVDAVAQTIWPKLL